MNSYRQWHKSNFPTTNLKWNRHRPAFLSPPSHFAVESIICLLPLLHTIYSWKGRLQIYVLYQSHEKCLPCIFTCNWTLWRIRPMRSKETERSHKNGATHHHPSNTWKLSKLDATAMSVARREAEGWHSWYTQFKICFIEPGPVKVISSCLLHINLPYSCASTPESRTKKLSGLP